MFCMIVGGFLVLDMRWVLFFVDATVVLVGTMDVESVTPGLQNRCAVSSQKPSYLMMRNLPLRKVLHYTASQLSCTILFDKEPLKR